MQEIRLIMPLRLAWRRMVQILFRNFSSVKWLAFSLSVWLANLDPKAAVGAFHTQVSNSCRKLGSKGQFPDLNRIFDESALLIGAIVVTGLLIMLILALLLVWVKARFQFVFLHNTIKNNREISRPWDEYAECGNSLFVWKLVYGLIVLLVLIVLVAISVTVFVLAVQSRDPGSVLSLSTDLVLGIVLTAMLLTSPFAIISLFILRLLNSFVVPIMYKYKLPTTMGWRYFLPFLKMHFWHFVLYFLFLLVLRIGIVIVLAVFACVTWLIGGTILLIGGIILSLPYVGSVLTLPILVWFRLYSVEYLTQFSPDFDFFPKPEGSAATPATPTGSC